MGDVLLQEEALFASEQPVALRFVIKKKIRIIIIIIIMIVRLIILWRITKVRTTMTTTRGRT